MSYKRTWIDQIAAYLYIRLDINQLRCIYDDCSACKRAFWTSESLMQWHANASFLHIVNDANDFMPLELPDKLSQLLLLFSEKD